MDQENVVSAPALVTSKDSTRRNGNLIPIQKGQVLNPAGGRKTKLIRKRLLRALLACNGDKQAIDAMAQNQVRLATGEGSTAVAAFEAIRDTVDGRPSSEDGAQTGIAVSLRFIGGASDELKAALKS